MKVSDKAKDKLAVAFIGAVLIHFIMVVLVMVGVIVKFW